MTAPLPIESVLPRLREVLRAGPNAVLEAPPGAGKTTGVPLALLDEPWLNGRRIVMLEPRRLAARAAARRMADLLGESVGETVGYRVRLDSAVGPRTRIEVVTEGILTRRLQRDPELAGCGAVIFDEFHERSLHADLGLALCLETQAALREDLRLVVMSATLDGGPVARLLGGAPVVTGEGRAYPVATRYFDRPATVRVEDAMTGAVLRALDDEDGDILAFLPGAGEIRRVERRLADAGLPASVSVTPLFGDLAQEAQDAAIAPAPPGRRKVVLATSIAETSLTIEGVRVVIDGGLMRVPRFDPRGGMTRLDTVKVSRASADQRRGRAGRVAPGVCYRLWGEAANGGLVPFTTPEIMETDLAPLALELARWGTSDAGTLAWLDPPPAAALAQGRDLLTRLGALDADGRITAHGRDMSGLGAHPRLAHMLLKGRELGLGRLACDVAALLAERDIVRARPGERDADLTLRLDVLRGASTGLAVDRNAVRHARRLAEQWRRQLAVKGGEGESPRVGLLVALAYPDRIAQRRSGGAEGQFRLSGGSGATLAPTEPLAAADWLAVADLDGARRDARIYLAAPLSPADLDDGFAGEFSTETFVSWDAREEAVLARRRLRLGALVLKDEALRDPDPTLVMAALVDGIRSMGLAALPWTAEANGLRARTAFLRRVAGEDWPDWSDEALAATLDDWLAPHLAGLSRRSHLKALELAEILRGGLDWSRRRDLDDLAPTHMEVPSGSRIPIDYGDAEAPVLAVRLQEMFGSPDTPRVAGGKVPLTLHLLSPASRPVQVTRDLASFWANGYREVKADLKGRYPRHYWPDDPLQAQPTNRTKKKMGVTGGR